jgi:hypothetical protein
METKNTLILFAITFAILTIGAFSWAAEGGVKVPLMAMKQHPNASGTPLISTENISVQAEGLRANGVYTVWFVNIKPKKHEAGAGEAPYMFKTDSYGNESYSAPLKESPFGKWQMLMIVLHPTGDPKDMKNMVGALSARL